MRCDVDFRLKTFAAEATKRLAPLMSEHGFTGPTIGETKQGMPRIDVRYIRGDDVVETSLALYYMGEEYVTTQMWRLDNVKAGRVEVGTDTTHKGHQMRKALDRQVDALRDLLRTVR